MDANIQVVNVNYIQSCKSCDYLLIIKKYHKRSLYSNLFALT